MDVNLGESPEFLRINKLYKNEGPTNVRTILFIRKSLVVDGIT